MTGTTFVEALATQCRIGCNRTERSTEQPILIDVTCEWDMTKAVVSDSRRDCIDYCTLHKIALDLARDTTYHLLEKLAHQIALRTLELPLALSVSVRIRKPHKLAGAAAVGISLTLHKEPS